MLALAAIAFGVIATYATAWAAVWWGPMGVSRKYQVKATTKGWTDGELTWPWTVAGKLERPTHATIETAWGRRDWSGSNRSNAIYVGSDAEAVRAAEHGLYSIIHLDLGELPDYGTSTIVCETRAGWPIMCLRHGQETTTEEYLPLREWRAYGWVVHANRPAWRGIMARVAIELPVRPIWFPFLANVAALSGVFVATCLGVTWLFHGRRIARRHRLGLCLACGYDLAGLAACGACPECGTGVGARA